MIRFAACCFIALMATAQANAAGADPAAETEAAGSAAEGAPATDATATPQAVLGNQTASAEPSAETGSPSNATATVSPATVADAVSRADARGSPGEPESMVGISLGTSIAGGNFGSAQSSRLWSTALGARLSLGTLRLTASVPYLRIRSRGTIFSGIDSTPVIVAGGTPGPRATNDGWGDVTVGAAYTLPAGSGQPEIEVSGRVKFPTAKQSDRLSTGKTDYSAGVQVTQQIGRMAPFVSATYRVFGDPRSHDLKNGIAASAGTSVSLGDRSVALFSYHYARKASRLVRDSHELFAAASTRVGESRFRLTGFATAGLSRGAAAASGGLSVSLDF